MPLSALGADSVLAVHFLFFLFCVGGEAAVLAGAVLERVNRPKPGGAIPTDPQRVWFRNRPFRIIHLAAVVFVGIEGLLGAACPLTTWEYLLREAAGQGGENEIAFVPRILRALLFHDYPPWVFTVLYVGFALLVTATFILVRPEKKKRSGNR